MTEEAPRTQFPVKIERQHASGDRHGRIIVMREGADAVREANRGIASYNDEVRRSNPDAMPAARVTGIITVYDPGHRAYHSIHLHRLDPSPAVGNVVVFSKPKYAPHRTENLQLATSGYYRKQDDLVPGIRDQHDGTLTRDGTQWVTSIIGGTVSAQLLFISSSEPWVYCASQYRIYSDLRRLRRKFDDSYGYSVATRIPDTDAFAAWLGIDFALGLDKSADVSLDPLDEIRYANSSYTTRLREGSNPTYTLIYVYYGPVNYEDMSGRVDRQEHFFDPNAGPMACFTKKAAFAWQSEYRFAFSTRGVPVRPKHYIAVSPELRALTCVV